MISERIYTAIQIGKPAYDREHGAMRMLWQRFGPAIREDRRKLGIPLKVFAAKLGLSRGMVSFLESGKREWSDVRAQRAIKILKQ